MYFIFDRKNGLSVIQQRYNPDTKHTYWTEIDPWLTDSLYLHQKFKEFFDERSGPAQDGIYPTVTIRQIMLAFKMKPIPRERWETCFDRRDIRFAQITITIMVKNLYLRRTKL